MEREFTVHISRRGETTLGGRLWTGSAVRKSPQA